MCYILYINDIGIKLDTYVCNTLIALYADLDDPEAATTIFNFMKEVKMKLQIITYNAMLRAWGKKVSVLLFLCCFILLKIL